MFYEAFRQFAAACPIHRFITRHDSTGNAIMNGSCEECAKKWARNMLSGCYHSTLEMLEIPALESSGKERGKSNVVQGKVATLRQSKIQ